MLKEELISSTATELLITSQDGLAPLTRKVANILSLPVLLTDTLYYPLFSTTVDGIDGCEEILAIERHDMDEDEGIFMCRIMTLNAEEIGWGSPIRHGDKTLGYWFIIDRKDTLSLSQARSILDYISPLAAFHLQKKIEIKSEKQKFKEPFLYDIIYGNLKSDSDIIENGKIWGWDFSLPQMAVVFSLHDYSDTAADTQILSNLYYNVERTLFERSVKPVAVSCDNLIIVILSIDEKNRFGKEFVKDYTNMVLKLMEANHPGRQFKMGIGKMYTKPSDVHLSFQEAKVALELGQLLDIRQPYFPKLGLEWILYKHDQKDLREYYYETLGLLINNQEANENGLLETLEAYCENQFDITATSNALFLHRNTLRYRLKKIEEILGLRLDDIKNKMDITAAFKIKQLKKL